MNLEIRSKLQSLLTAANAKTGESDTTLTDAVQTLVDGYGQGGGGGEYQKKTGTFSVASDYTYAKNANGSYTGSILIATGLSTIKAVVVWSEEWLDGTETNPCFGAAVFYDCGFGFSTAVKQPDYFGAAHAVMLQNATNRCYSTQIAGIIPANATTGITAGSFGLRVHSSSFPLKAGHTIHWEAIGT